MNSIPVFHNIFLIGTHFLERLSSSVTLFRMSFTHSLYVLNAYHVIEVAKPHLFTVLLMSQ